MGNEERPFTISSLSRAALVITDFKCPFDPVACKLRARSESLWPKSHFSPQLLNLHRPGETMVTLIQVFDRLAGPSRLLGWWHLEYLRINLLIPPEWNGLWIYGAGDRWIDPAGNTQMPYLRQGNELEGSAVGIWQPVAPALVHLASGPDIVGLNPNGRILAIK